MISLTIALAIALLTLLTPSSAETGAPRPAPGAPAMWAELLPEMPSGLPDPFEALMGDWIATVNLPEGDSQETHIRVRHSEGNASGGERGPVLVSMGHGDECFTGPVAAHFEGSDVVFASAAEAPDLGTATISGRMVGRQLTGSAFLPDHHRLVTWTAARPPSI